LINPCRTPAIHPILWHDARRLYWSLANLSASGSMLSRNKLIYIQRTTANSNNPGRYIVNEEPFIEILRQYAIKSSLKFFQYDHSKQQGNIVKQIQLFYRARIIIGVHGGAQSNINFAQPGTTIIEIMPYRPRQSTIPIVCSLDYPDELAICVGYIYYIQSQLLNHSYWILPTPVERGNITVSLTRVKRLFDSLV
jgi:capsular polysaccharide biosynthesis protein